MKIVKLLLVVSLIVLSCCAAAAADDARFTCESNIADFSGKTFENLYLDLEGCGDAVTFTDLTVTGNLVYNGGKDAVDHNITLDKPAIQNMFVPCESTHNVNITFIPSDDVEYVVSEMTVMPSGSEKGKVVLNGTGKKTLPIVGTKYTQDFFTTVIDRVNYVAGNITDEIAAGFRSSIVPAGLPDLSSADGNNELEINDIIVMEMSVVNTNSTVLPAVTSNTQYAVYLLAAFSPSLKLYSKNADGYYSGVESMITTVDGSEFNLSVDKVTVEILHFLGNNNPESLLRVAAGGEKLHKSENVIDNIFLFGSNMEMIGYGKPNRRVMNNYRTIIVEQPAEYSLKSSPMILNEFLANYVSPTFAEDNNWPEEARYLTDDMWDEVTEDMLYESRLDASSYFLPRATRYLSTLSQKYAVNRPDSETHWKPYINLSYANIGKAICAESITKEVDPYQMIHIKHESYMNTQPDVMRYVMPNGVTASLAEEPKVTGQTMLDDLFAGLEDGCYVFSIDEYGRPYLVE